MKGWQLRGRARTEVVRGGKLLRWFECETRGVQGVFLVVLGTRRLLYESERE